MRFRSINGPTEDKGLVADYFSDRDFAGVSVLQKYTDKEVA